MASPEIESSRLSSFLTFATILLVVMILRVAQDVVVPVALSILLAFLLSPVVNRLARWGFPEVLAVGCTASLAFVILAALGWIVGVQAMAVIEDLPNHEQNIRAKLASLHTAMPGGSLSQTTGMVNSLAKEVDTTAEPEHSGRERRRANEPVPVIVTGSRESRLETVRHLVTPALGPLGTAGIVIVFVVVVLFQRHDLRDRFINLISAGQMNVATQAVDDAARRVSRYLGMQLFVNATYGIPVAIGLYFIGVPGALLWGLLATVLRFIPFIGPWIAAAFPIVLAAAIDPGWSKLLYTVAMFIVLELISNNVVEVVVYGTSTGISSFALLVAAVFWTWLWGTAGLFMSTPLTACLLVMGKYVPGLKFLSVVLGSAPAMSPASLFYQRMLSMNLDGMLALARQVVKDRSIEAFYDEVFVPALTMAEEERHRGALAEVRQRFIVQAGAELVEELANDDENCASKEALEEGAAESLDVVIIPGADEADELTALMLQHVLDCRGHRVAVCPLTAMHADRDELVRRSAPRVLVVSALPPSAVSAGRKMCRLLKGEHPRIPVVVAVWCPQVASADLQSRFRFARPDGLVTSMGEAAVSVHGFLREEQRQQDRGEAGLPEHHEPGAEPAELFDRIRRELAAAFEVPVSLLKIADVDRNYWNAMPWFTGQGDVVGGALRDTPLAAAGAEDGVIEIADVRKDKRVAANPVLEERGVRYLACAPLRLRDARLVGLLCVVDTRVRSADPECLRGLAARAGELMDALEAGATSVSAARAE